MPHPRSLIPTLTAGILLHLAAPPASAQPMPGSLWDDAVLGDADTIAQALAGGADPNELKGGATPLCAIFQVLSQIRSDPKGRVESIRPRAQRLLDAGAEPNARCDREGRTPLILAVEDNTRQDLSETVAFLLDAGADPRRKDKRGKSALSRVEAAARGQHPEELIARFARTLREHRGKAEAAPVSLGAQYAQRIKKKCGHLASPDSCLRSRNRWMYNVAIAARAGVLTTEEAEGRGPLSVAAERVEDKADAAALIDLLVRAGVTPTKADLAWLRADAKRAEVSPHLIAFVLEGPASDGQSDNGRTALSRIWETEAPDKAAKTAADLLAGGRRPSAADLAWLAENWRRAARSGPLMAAALKSHGEAMLATRPSVDALVDAGASVEAIAAFLDAGLGTDAVGADGHTLLSRHGPRPPAAVRPVVELLLSRGAKQLNPKTNRPILFDVIDIADQYGMEYALKLGYDPNHRDQDGLTALMYSAARFAPDAPGRRPAKDYEYQQIFEMLLDAADREAPDPSGRTIYHHVAMTHDGTPYHKAPDLIALLVARGVRPSPADHGALEHFASMQDKVAADQAQLDAKRAERARLAAEQRAWWDEYKKKPIESLQLGQSSRRPPQSLGSSYYYENGNPVWYQPVRCDPNGPGVRKRGVCCRSKLSGRYSHWATRDACPSHNDIRVW